MMSKSLRPLAGLGLVFLVSTLVGCGSKPSPTQPGEQTPVLPDTLPPAPKPPEGWSKFQGEGFSVNVPDAVQFKRKMDEFGGVTTPSNTWTNSVPHTPGQLGYNVRFDPLPAGVNPEIDKVKAEFKADPEKAWAARKEMMAKGSNEKMENEKPITVPGGFGRQFTNTFGRALCLTRVAFTDKGVYTWGVMGEKQPDENAPEVKAFFDSFRIE